MRTLELQTLFGLLARPTKPGQLVAQRIGDSPSYRIARAHDDSVVLLISCRRDVAAEAAAPIRLENFEYEPQVTAQIREGEKTQKGEFLCLRCLSNSDEVREHFIRLVEGLVDQLGAEPTSGTADRAVRDLVELFRAMSAPATKTITGLWGELLTIYLSSDPAFLAASWHSDPSELHDFAAGADRLEVKTTLRPIREHDVGLDQLEVPRGGLGLLVSLMLEQSDTGVTTQHLLDLCLSRLAESTESRRRVRAIVAETIGRDWRLLSEAAFDLDGARSSLRIFEFGRVPTPDRRSPPEVSRVRFTVDLSAVAPYVSSDARPPSPLFSAVGDRGGPGCGGRIQQGDRG